MHSYVHCSTINNNQDMEAPECPSTDKMDKEDVLRIYSGILLSHKKMPFAATWMQLEIIILHEVSQKGKDNYCMVSRICGI